MSHQAPAIPVVSAPRLEALSPRRSRSVAFLAGALRLLRVLLALALFALAALVLWHEATGRAAEADLFAWVLQHASIADYAAGSSNAGVPAVTFSYDDRWYSLRITVQCSISFYLAAVLALSGLLALSRGIALWRLAVATVSGLVGLVMLNQLRLAVIAYAFSRGGHEAFAWAHGPLGTVLMMVGMGLVLLIYFLLCIRPSRRAKRALEAGSIA